MPFRCSGQSIPQSPHSFLVYYIFLVISVFTAFLARWARQQYALSAATGAVNCDFGCSNMDQTNHQKQHFGLHLIVQWRVGRCLDCVSLETLWPRHLWWYSTDPQCLCSCHHQLVWIGPELSSATILKLVPGQLPLPCRCRFWVGAH